MTTAILATLLLLTPEHWFAGREYELRLPVSADLPAPTLIWQLMLGDIPLVSGKVAIPEKSPSATLRITVPPVRAFARLKLNYNLVRGRQEDAAQTGTIYAYPPLDWKPTAKLLADHPLVIIGSDKRWGEYLSAQGLKTKFLSDPNAVDLDDSPMLVVMPDCITEASQLRPLLDAARTGRHVLIFPQHPKEPLGGLVWEKTPPGGKVSFDLQHALLAGCDKIMLDTWAEMPTEVWGIRIASDPHLTIVAVLMDKAEKTTHAFLAEQFVGKGTIAWLTLPWGPPAEDPRSAMLIHRWVQVHVPSGDKP